MAHPSDRIRRVRAALFLGGLASFAALLVSSHVPCVFASTFGVPCPGCGSTRAMVALVRRDFTSFVRYNPIAPLATALMVAYALWALRSLLAVGTLARVGEGRAGRVLLMATLGVAALEFVLWIARFAGFFGGPVPV